MKKLYQVQADAIDSYYKHLKQFGYMNDVTTSQMLAAIILIDSLEYFEGLVDERYFNDVIRIIRELQCCNCTIKWDDFKGVNTNPIASFLLTTPIRVIELVGSERAIQIGDLRLPNEL